MCQEERGDPADTKSLDAKLLAFVKLEMGKAAARECTRHAPNIRSIIQVAPIGSGILPKQPPQTQVHQQTDSIKNFVTFWGLNARSERSLRSLTPDDMQAIITGFAPSPRTKNVNKKFA